MNKEKILKDFTIKFIAETVISCSVLFIWIFLFVYDIIDEKAWVISGIALIAAACAVSYFDKKINGKKNEKQLRRVMPMIISIKDTPESLKKDKDKLFWIGIASFSFGFAFRETSFIFIVLMAMSNMFRKLEYLTGEKIKYLENKPEGL